MKRRWRPSVDEERWLVLARRLAVAGRVAVGARPGAALPREIAVERGGGWRGTGPLARIASFALGLLAAALLIGLLYLVGGGHESSLLVAGLTALAVAEGLILAKRLHASGIEEGLWVAGALLAAGWLVATAFADAGQAASIFVLIAALGVAGLRLLNPLVTTAAVVALVHWARSTVPAQAVDAYAGPGVAVLLFGSALALLALALGARTYRRPSHDRMLDGMVATLPAAAYVFAESAAHATAESGVVSAVDGARWITVVLLLLVGATLLATGLRRRRHAPLWGALGCLTCLGVELQASTGLAVETWLLVCGFAALAVGAIVDRVLRRPRDGLTSTPLDDGDGSLDRLQTPGAAILAGRATPAPPPVDSGMTPGGGRFGGGGATGSF